jgi:hypothetical protein
MLAEMHPTTGDHGVGFFYGPRQEANFLTEETPKA